MCESNLLSDMAFAAFSMLLGGPLWLLGFVLYARTRQSKGITIDGVAERLPPRKQGLT